MRHRNLRRPVLLLAFSLWSLLTPARTAMADLTVTYEVSVNTPSGLGSGYIDFQFNPAMGNTLPTDAKVSSFSTDGTVGDLVFQSGDATGSSMGPLTTTLSFDNGTSLNELT